MATAPVEAIQATVRSGKFNKNAARRVRVSGLIPAVVYGAGQESIALTVDPKAVTKILHSESGHNTIFDLAINHPAAGANPAAGAHPATGAGTGTTKAMIVDWQNEPIKGKLLHIDMKRIAMNVRMQVSVPIVLAGTPIGVKTQGGILDQILREVEVECLPGDIPSHLDVDVSNLELNGTIHISDLPHSGSLKFLGEEDELVAHVTLVKETAEDVADAAAAATPAEPEVAKKGKTDEAAPAADAKGGKK